MPLVFWVIAFPLVPVNSPYYDENTRHPQSTCLADLQNQKYLDILKTSKPVILEKWCRTLRSEAITKRYALVSSKIGLSITKGFF